MSEYDSGVVDSCIGIIRFILDGLDEETRKEVLKALKLEQR